MWYFGESFRFMTVKQYIKRIRYYGQYFPFTWHTVGVVLASIVLYKILYRLPNPKLEEPLPYLPLILLMAKVAAVFVVAVISFSLMSAIVCWLYFLWVKKKKGNQLQLKFTLQHTPHQPTTILLEAELENAFRPFLGFIKSRLFYDDGQLTPLIKLLSNKKDTFPYWGKTKSGSASLQLDDTKEYELKGGFIYFQDMLHLVSFAVAQPVTGHFYQPPTLKAKPEMTVYPKQTTTTDVRIEQMKRVDGDYLNYKDFEAGDDVRRIVWKLYAKNRDLVVRVPERFEPFASHVYFYASFYAADNWSQLSNTFFKELLNYYKNSVWTVYDTLAKKEWELRYVPDLQFTIHEQATIAAKNARIISNSYWHQEISLQAYFNPSKGSVLCISSFTDAEALRERLAICDSSTVVYFVKCSQVFQHSIPLHLIKRLLFLPPADRLQKTRITWLLSPMRIAIKRKEALLETILKESNVVYGVL